MYFALFTRHVISNYTAWRKMFWTSNKDFRLFQDITGQFFYWQLYSQWTQDFVESLTNLNFRTSFGKVATLLKTTTHHLTNSDTSNSNNAHYWLFCVWMIRWCHASSSSSWRRGVVSNVSIGHIKLRQCHTSVDCRTAQHSRLNNLIIVNPIATNSPAPCALIFVLYKPAETKS